MAWVAEFMCTLVTPTDKWVILDSVTKQEPLEAGSKGWGCYLDFAKLRRKGAGIHRQEYLPRKVWYKSINWGLQDFENARAEIINQEHQSRDLQG